MADRGEGGPRLARLRNGLVAVTLLALALVALALAALATVLVAAGNRDRADEALRKVEVAQKEIHRHAVLDELQRELICSRSHPENCRALADRLLNYTTPAQSHRLWCELLAYGGTRFGRQQRKRSHCPPLLAPPQRTGGSDGP